ncbi:IucA/IucC family protein [Permianibacter aggregans]|uniref:N2-citryl-N6-acetyl-N6-hydroxylysine synthase n=1 Tax=Permianibacter aggregans TaxID=1510150 RepID=A0A4R6UMG6_9GAMM|nr:IucA/IucC family protein [Permianibacter aggregans]TDQ48111.1 N2-citryl-N6-acetyl-N6-hydroxylysine synthase [Permianibacter aggregans]
MNASELARLPEFDLTASDSSEQTPNQSVRKIAELSELVLSELELPTSSSPQQRLVQTAAEQLSANCYFNALLRECEGEGWQWRQAPAVIRSDNVVNAVRLSLPSCGGWLWLLLSHQTLGGRHQFVLPCWLQAADGRLRPLGFAEAVTLTASEPALFGALDKTRRELFIERVKASNANIETALRARWQDLPVLFNAPLNFADAEQALLVGHSVHPNPKSRDQFSHGDAERFAPEYGNEFALHWLAVAPEFLHARSAHAHSALELAQQVFDSEPMACAARPSPPPGMVLMPAHPWQLNVLKRDARLQPLFASGDIVDLGSFGGGWRATSSTRSIYARHAPFMLKFSLSVRLTNSLRTLLPKEMQRGLQVHQVQQSPVGAQFAERCPQFTILSEPAYLCLKDGKGQLVAESLVLFRDNPFVAAAADNCCVLATLTQDHPLQGKARVITLIEQFADEQKCLPAEAARRWFTAFLDTVVEPLFIAQAEFGLLFGAHQQNLVLRFDGALPVHGYFRDCQGTGYSHVAHQLLSPYLPELGAETENLIDNEMANRLFSYYLIVNSCFGVVSAIAAGGVIGENLLLQLLHDRLNDLRQQAPADRSCLDYLLDSALLWSKGNFRCSYQNVNETTTTDPLSVYHTMPNPLFRL